MDAQNKLIFIDILVEICFKQYLNVKIGYNFYNTGFLKHLAKCDRL